MPNLSMIARVAMALPMVAACSAREAADDERPEVLTTFTVIADMTKVVGGDAVRVSSIVEAGAEIHDYEPTASALRRAAGADLILDNGLGLEAWFSRFVDQLDVEHVVLSDGVEPMPISEGPYEGISNPHAWMSPLAAQTYVDNIVGALIELLPEHKADFERRGAAYKQQLQEALERFRADVESLPPERRALVTCEGAFGYLARDTGLSERYLWPTNGENEGTPLQIAASIRFVRANDVPSIFCESTVNSAAQEQVAKESGAKLGGRLYVDSLSTRGGDVPTYLDLLDYDRLLIIAGLSAP